MLISIHRSKPVFDPAPWQGIHTTTELTPRWLQGVTSWRTTAATVAMKHAPAILYTMPANVIGKSENPP
jgi:hypothetical protein